MMASGTNAVAHHELRTMFRICIDRDIVGSQAHFVFTPTHTASPASEAPATIAKYASARRPSHASRSAVRILRYSFGSNGARSDDRSTHVRNASPAKPTRATLHKRSAWSLKLSGNVAPTTANA